MMVPFSKCVFRLKTNEMAGFIDADQGLRACQPRLDFRSRPGKTGWQGRRD
jgi:hypothetical protein